MSTLQIQLHRRLASAVDLTGRLKAAPRRSRPLAAALRGLDFGARGVFYLWRNRRYLTTLKLLNMAAVNIQFRLKTQYVFGRPYNMKIESTNICNTHCQLCPTGLGYEGREKGKMDLAHFQGLVDRFRHFLLGLDLSMWGDPLIVPDIYKMIRYAHDKGVWTYVSSNLHAFKPEKGHAELLVRSGLDMLTCSLHGASQETFAQYQPGKNFGDAVAKIRDIVATRERLGSTTPVVQLNFVVTRFNEHERPAFERLARELGCRAVFSAASLNTRFLSQPAKGETTALGLAPDLLARRTRAHLEKWLPRDPAFVIEPYRQILAGHEPKGDQYNGTKLLDCSWPWRAAVVNWDGSVSTCCGSWDPREDLGNVLHQPFGKIWNGTRYRMARKSFTKRVDPEHAKDNACASCPGFML